MLSYLKKKLTFLGLGLALVQSPIYCRELSSQNNDLLDQAERLVHETLYTEASLIYQEVLSTKDSGLPKHETTELSYRLAQIHALNHNYDAIIPLLQNLPEQHSNPSETEKNSIFLLALAYQNLGRYQESINTFRTYLNLGERKLLPHHDEALFELSVNYYKLGKLSQARSSLESIPNPSQSEQTTLSIPMYLAKIDLAEGNDREAENRLRNLANELSQSDLLRYELAYVQGELHFYRHDYVKAAEYFELSLSAKKNSPWRPHALYNLGWSYMKIADVPTQTAEQQKLYFDKAENIWLKLLKESPEDKIYLALIQEYLMRGRRINDEEALKSANKLLENPSEIFTTDEAKSQAILLKAETSLSYEERSKYYSQFTHDSQKENQAYAEGWYLRGINDYEEAQRLRKIGEQPESVKLFEQAINSLQEAFTLFYQEQLLPNAGLALKYRAFASFYQQTPETTLRAYQIIDSFFSQYPNILKSIGAEDEILYFKALIASNLIDGEDGQKYEESLKKSIKQIIKKYPQSPFAPEALKLLGSLSYRKGDYAEAELAFAKLAKDYPVNSFAGDALNFASICAEKQQKERLVCQQYRRQVFEKYPLSSLAAEAYFNYFSYNEYLQGNPEALKHLQKFTEKYPNSPFVINAYYLMGLEHKRPRRNQAGKVIHKANLTAAIDSFQEAETAFDRCYKSGLISSENLACAIEIRYRSTLERALANLSIANDSISTKKQIYLQYSRDVFKHMIAELENLDTSPTLKFLKEEPYKRLKEESSFGLAQTYLKADDDETAEKLLDSMLEKYSHQMITRGYFLSRIWYEKGMIAVRKKQPEEALKNFSNSEDAGKGKVLSIDQKLDLWIQQSNCYRCLNQLENAMLWLSKVINEDAVSTLRLKAMYLRAEIYEMEDRPELARKQLEAVANKGGEWAQKAKKKLEHNEALKKIQTRTL